MTETAQTLAALGATPLAGDSPAGVSIRYEPEFEQIETEISKLQSIHQEAVAWDTVITTGTAILADKSKDLTVACYLCLALFERDGYDGLATGLQIIRDLIAQFWDSLFPELRRLRARASAVSWLGEKTGATLARQSPGAGDRAAVAKAFALVAEIDTLLGQRLHGQDYSLMDLYRPLKELQREAERSAQAPAVPPTRPAAAGGAAAGGADLAAVTVASPADAQKVVRACQGAIKTVAGFLRQQKLSDPAPYRMLRFATWMSIDRRPPDNGGETQLPSVAGEKRLALESMLAAGDYLKVIPDVEETLVRAPLWLDIHRYAATAMQELGEEFTAARAAVVAALAEFVQRLPGLMELRFQGGAPFADETTRAWLDSEVLTAAAAAEATAPGPTADDPRESVLREAKQLKMKKKLKQALELFQAARAQGVNERERFLWDLAQARFCFESGLVELALPQLDHLDRQVERFALEEWEPALSIEVARLILMCNYKLKESAQGRPGGVSERVERARVRLYRLDPSAALELQK